MPSSTPPQTHPKTTILMVMGLTNGSLLLKDQRRTADALAMEVDIHLNAIGDRDEGNALIHPIVLAVKGHYALNLAYACPLAGNRQRQRLRFRFPAYRKVTRYIKVGDRGLHRECNRAICRRNYESRCLCTAQRR